MRLRQRNSSLLLLIHNLPKQQDPPLLLPLLSRWCEARPQARSHCQRGRINHEWMEGIQLESEKLRGGGQIKIRADEAAHRAFRIPDAGCKESPPQHRAPCEIYHCRAKHTTSTGQHSRGELWEGYFAAGWQISARAADRLERRVRLDAILLQAPGVSSFHHGYDPMGVLSASDRVPWVRSRDHSRLGKQRVADQALVPVF